ncbi:hypothetical protein H4Q26_007938 [Puccinia striiformis f. sp. tritici PST-130]|nr:hypothetical protein H4Q26_007938 [Puccinia striiformis f. sp. tritici PST-130]
MGDSCSKLIYRDMWNVDQFGCPTPRVMISRSQPVIQASHWLIKHIHLVDLFAFRRFNPPQLPTFLICLSDATAAKHYNTNQQVLAQGYRNDYTDALANTPALDGGLRISWPILSSNSSSPSTVPPGSTVVSRSQWPTGTHSTFGALPLDPTLAHLGWNLESVRNLTETQLPQSIKLIIQNKAIFGYQIYSLAINMMSTLIHSEPTSLATLQEAGLPKALYDAIDSGIEPAFDVIAAIPSALGALCLNDVGLEQLNERQAIPAIFSVFTSERHAQILRDRDHASVVGSTIDELVQHQPTLKKMVLDATLTYLKEIDRIGKAIDINASQVVNVQLKSCPEDVPATAIKGSTASLPVASSLGGPDDVVMSESQVAPTSTANLFQSATASISKKEKEKDEKDHYSNNLVLLLIDVACRILESMLQNVAHCQEFLNLGTLDLLLGLLRLPSIPYDFATTPAAEAFSSTIRVVTETLPGETLRTATGILGVFNKAEELETVSFLGALQRVVCWEHILIKAFAPKPWSDGSTPTAAFTSTTVYSNGVGFSSLISVRALRASPVPLRVCAPGTQVRSELSPQADISGSSPGGRTPSIELGATPLAINSRLDSTTISNLSRLNPANEIVWRSAEITFQQFSQSSPVFMATSTFELSSSSGFFKNDQRILKASFEADLVWVQRRFLPDVGLHCHVGWGLVVCLLIDFDWGGFLESIKGSSFLPFSSSSIHPHQSTTPQSPPPLPAFSRSSFSSLRCKTIVELHLLTRDLMTLPKSAIPSGMRSPVYSPRSQWLRGHETIHLRRGALPRRSYVRFEQTEFNPPMADPNTAQLPRSHSISSWSYSDLERGYSKPFVAHTFSNIQNPGPINFEQNNNAQASSTSYPVYRPLLFELGHLFLWRIELPDNLIWPIDVDGPPEYDHGIEDGGNEASSTTGENPARNEPADPNEDL